MTDSNPARQKLFGELVTATKILLNEGIMDTFGHISARDPEDPESFFLAQKLAPSLITVEDIQRFNLDGETSDNRPSYLERYIHSEIYKARPDVMAVVHSHSPGVIPFSVSQVSLRPVFHNAAFLGAGAPVWEIRKEFGDTNMLVSNAAIGKSLALALADKSVVLMRGHGDATVGPSVKLAVFRAYYTDVNARLQSQALALGGEVNYLTPAEATKADAVNLQVLDRVWNLWKIRVTAATK